MQPCAFTCHVHRWCTFGALYSENVTDKAENADKTPRKQAKKPQKHRKNVGYSRVRIVAKIPKSAASSGFSGFVFWSGSILVLFSEKRTKMRLVSD